MTFPRPGDKKYEVLEIIDSYTRTHHRPPSVEEIRIASGLGTRSAVQFHIDDLKELELVENLARRARTIRTTTKGKKLIKLMASLGGDGPTVENPSPSPPIPSENLVDDSNGSPEG